MKFFDITRSPFLRMLGFFKNKSVEVVERKPWSDVEIILSDEDKRVIDTTKVLTMNWDEKGTDLSGEYKRHQVYSKLVKIFPHYDRKKLSLFIELVLSGLV